jgi:hypothetical protein
LSKPKIIREDKIYAARTGTTNFKRITPANEDEYSLFVHTWAHEKGTDLAGR